MGWQNDIGTTLSLLEYNRTEFIKRKQKKRTLNRSIWSFILWLFVRIKNARYILTHSDGTEIRSCDLRTSICSFVYMYMVLMKMSIQRVYLCILIFWDRLLFLFCRVSDLNVGADVLLLSSIEVKIVVQISNRTLSWKFIILFDFLSKHIAHRQERSLRIMCVCVYANVTFFRMHLEIVIAAIFHDWCSSY